MVVCTGGISSNRQHTQAETKLQTSRWEFLGISSHPRLPPTKCVLGGGQQSAENTGFSEYFAFLRPAEDSATPPKTRQEYFGGQSF
jgi:hypothetical protein